MLGLEYYYFYFGCIAIALKTEGIVNSLVEQGIQVTVEQVKSYIPIILFGFICFTSLMSSITSSMISLEGKSFSILKSLPVKPITIILCKILTAIIIMIPIILIGDLIIFIRFKLSILEIFIILITSIILPLVAETLGIIINIKYPKMDAENDTEVVKQSISSMVAVLLGMALTGITIAALVISSINNIPSYIVILSGLIIYIIVFIRTISISKQKKY